jgi:polyhydroxyalkanoate synthesis regulator phasin
MGLISKQEGEQLMQALENGTKGSEEAKGSEGRPAKAEGDGNAAPPQNSGHQLDALGPQLEKLLQLTEQATAVKGEIDERVKAGELTADAGKTAKADIDRGLEDAKRAVLQPGNNNDIHGHNITDDEILGSVANKLGAMDKNLDKLVGDRTDKDRSAAPPGLDNKIDELLSALKDLIASLKGGDSKEKGTADGRPDHAAAGSNSADKAIGDANRFYDDSAKPEASTEDKLSKLKDLIQKLVDMGLISKQEGEQLMQALENGTKGSEEAKGSEGRPAKAEGDGNAAPPQNSGHQLDALGPQLEKLLQLTEQATAVKGEIDERVKAGELTADAGKTAKADIDRGLEDAKRAVLQPGNNNDIHGHNITDDEILGSVATKLGAMDENLDKLAESDAKADAARGRLTEMGNKGQLSQDETAKGIAAINEKQTATELAVLKW